jgi:hypothetical protein
MVRVNSEDVFADFVDSFRSHLVNGHPGLDVASMRSLAATKRYRRYVVVPGEYRAAYRLMWGVPADDIASVIGRTPGPLELGVCAYHSVRGDRVNSWTVDLEYLKRDGRLFLAASEKDLVPDEGDGYAVLLVAAIEHGRGRRAFWLNPDEMYDAAGDRWMSVEREVVSVGSVGRLVMSFARQEAGGKSTWNDLMDDVVDDADGNMGYADELAGCAGRRKRSVGRG